MNCFYRLALVLSALILTACGSDSIDTTGQDGENEAFDTLPQKGEGGAWTMTIDSSDYEAWQRVHLERGLARGDESWDIAVRRYVIRLNGGSSGIGGALAQWAEGLEFSEVTQAPSEGWKTDTADEDGILFGSWYDYDPMSHILTPKSGVWFLRGDSAQRYYALQIVDYYSEAGDAGSMTLVWKSIDAPEGDVPTEAGDGMLPVKPDNPQSQESDEAIDGGDGANMGGESSMTVGGSMFTAEDAGCYDPTIHMCDCELTETACAEAENVWTPGCGCTTK